MEKNNISANSTVAIIGLGYVGLPLALLAGEKGYEVYGVDSDAAKIAMLREGRSPIHDKRIETQLSAPDIQIEFVGDISVMSKAEIVVVCVPTPIDENHLPDLTILKAVCKQLGPYLKQSTLVIIESTVNPSVCEETVVPLLEENSGMTAGKDFYLAHCPERINPGDPSWHVGNIPRVVGSLEDTGLRKAQDFYESIIDAQIKPMASLREAETVKIVENAFRDVNIAFVNELAKSFAVLNINVTNVIEGAATKPFGYMPFYPTCGVGGHCIPVDPHYLIDYAAKQGFDHQLLKMARQINLSMPDFTVNLLSSALDDLDMDPQSVTVAVLGLAYKPEVDDCRESPSFDILKRLESKGIKTLTYDPFVLSKSSEKSIESALIKADAVIIATHHKAFKHINSEVLVSNGVKIVIDGRNFLPREQFATSGIVYKGIGR